MSAQDNAVIARIHLESFNQREFDRGAALIAENAEWINVPTAEIFRGQAGYKQFIQGWSTAMPDARVEITNVVASAEAVVTEFIGRGTHTGPLQTPAGPVPPTGKAIAVPFCEVMQLQNGKILGGRTYFDIATLMRQLGLMP